MIEVTDIPAAPATAVTSMVRQEAREGKWLWAMIGMLLIAPLPLLYWHLNVILSKAHFQFVMLLPFLVAALTWREWQQRDELVRGQDWVVAIWGGLALAVLATATWFWSPWLGAIGGMLTLVAVIYLAGGAPLWRVAFPGWSLLWFAVALPFDLDEDLIKILRTVATRWASRLLDQFGYFHLVEGNVIRVPGKAYFVADACSGIHSLFVILAAALFIGFWNRRSLLRMTVLLLCGAALVMIENLFRLVGVVLGGRAGVDLSEGAAHQVFGGVVFLATLLLVLSADQLVAFFVPERLLFWRRRRLSAPAGEERGADRIQPSWPKPLLAMSVCFLGTGLWQLQRAPWDAPALAPVAFDKAFLELATLKEGDLPEQIDGFRREGLRFEQRSQDDPKGSFSQIWTYVGQGLRVEMSVDYAYPTVRDLCLCYELTGWEVTGQSFVAGDSAVESPQPKTPYVRATLAKQFRGTATLLFSYFNSRGDIGARVYSREEQGLVKRSLARLSSLWRGPDDAASPVDWVEIPGPVAQIQLFAPSERELSDDQRAALARLYETARRTLHAACTRKLQGKS